VATLIEGVNFAMIPLYIATTILYLVYFVRGTGDFSRSLRVALVATIGIHVALTVIRWIDHGYIPLFQRGDALSLFSVCVMLVYAYLESYSRSQSMGIFVIGIAMIFQVAASLQFGQGVSIPEVLQSTWFAFHAGTAVLSFSGFAIAAVLSTLYLLLYRELHSAQPGYIYSRIPSLEMLDVTSFRAVALGFALLTIGIVSGSIWAQQAWGSFWSWDPKQCSALTTWLIYAAYLWVHARRGWRGKRVAIFALIGFILLLFTFVFVDLLFKTSHRFG
jgi:cytochrome c-type biogenesis protein CcsB